MSEIDEVYEIDLEEYLAILYKRKWVIIIIVLIAAVLSYIYSLYIPLVYQVESLLMVDNYNQGFVDMTDFPFNQTDKELETYSRLLKTNKLLGKVVEDIGDDSLAVKDLHDNLMIAILPGTNLIKITLKHTEPELAKTIVDSLINKFIINNRKLKISATSNTRSYVSEQLDKVSRELRELELELKEFKEEKGIVILAEVGRKLQDRLIELEKDLASMEVEINSNKVGIKYLKEQLPEHEDRVLASQTVARNPLVAELKSQLFEQEIKLTTLSSIYTEQHPEIIKLKLEKKAIEDRLVKLIGNIVTSSVYSDNPIHKELTKDLINLESELLALEARRDAVQSEADKLRQKMKKLPEQELKYSRLERRLQVTEKLYTMLLTRYQELNISEAMEVSDIKIVDPAVIPTNHVSPNKKLNVAIAVVLGLFLSIFVIFLLEFLDFTIRDPDELEDLTSVPLIGHIPDFADFSDYKRNR